MTVPKYVTVNITIPLQIVLEKEVSLANSIAPFVDEMMQKVIWSQLILYPRINPSSLPLSQIKHPTIDFYGSDNSNHEISDVDVVSINESFDKVEDKRQKFYQESLKRKQASLTNALDRVNNAITPGTTTN